MALKLHNRPLCPYYFSLSAVCVFAIWYEFERLHKPEVLISAIAALITFGVYSYKQHLDEAKLFKELFSEFNLRYDELNETLNSIKDRRDSRQLCQPEIDKVYSYFNLCAEEHFFHKAGYIDELVWNTWYRGMSIFFKNPQIMDLWDDEPKDTYYGFRPQI